ncbi:MAG TPA: hypothetical protein VLX61_05970 [Anaerolineales bacterium]|nr:hypothetical protein [Anaerolineales bacterium]
MNLNRTWKIVIGLGSLWVIAYPFVFVAFMFAMMGSVIVASGNANEPPPAFMLPFLSFFFIVFPLIFFSSFLQLGLSGFYLAHIIKNKLASDVVRIIFGIGAFYMPIIAMPFYYFVYIWPDTPPQWALESNKASA